MVNLPEEFEMKMKKLLGLEYEEFLASYDHPRNFGLRVNVDKISPKEFEKIAPFHLTKIPWTENGYYYEEQDMPARHPFYYAGIQAGVKARGSSAGSVRSTGRQGNGTGGTSSREGRAGCQ